MVEDPFNVEVERPFGEEISETASGQTVGGNPRARTRKRPAEGEGHDLPVKKTRQESQSQTGHPRAGTRKRPAEGEGDELPVKKTRQESQDSREGRGKNAPHELYEYDTNLAPKCFSKMLI
jgi:hypothetical protein